MAYLFTQRNKLPDKALHSANIHSYHTIPITTVCATTVWAPPLGIIRSHRNDAEKINTAPAQVSRIDPLLQRILVEIVLDSWILDCIAEKISVSDRPALA